MNTSKPIFLISVLISVIGLIVFAGSLIPSYPPVSTSYTLNDVYNLIENNATSTAGNHLFSTSAVVATTSHSINEIYALLANLIQRENIETGQTYLGVTGDYGNPDPGRAITSVIYSNLTPSSITPEGYTLNDIYNLIVNNATTTSGNHTLSTSTTPASSMYTITEIYVALLNLVNSTKVQSGITYLGKTGTMIPALASISISQSANKLTYYVGESLDIAGLIVIGTYNNGSTSTQSITEANITGFNSSAPVTGQTLTITVSGKTATYAVNIVAVTVPGAPTIGTATAGDLLATVTFTAPASNGGSAITGYTVTSNPAGGTDANAGSTDLSHTITGLTNGTSYTFTVTATNAVGQSSASAPSNSVTPAPLIWSDELGSWIPWDTGVSTCASMGGGSGWRLPTLSELVSALTNRRIEIGFLSDVFYWSSTEDGPTLAFVAWYDSGTTQVNTKFEFRTNGRRARCVHSGDLTLSSISITQPATKLTYYVGETLDISGLVVSGTYSDGSISAQYISTTTNITGFDSSAPATGQILTITVGGKTTTYTIDINALSVGSSYQGGIVAYILQSGDPGYVSGQTHGLIAPASNQSSGIKWDAIGYTTTNVTATAIGTGNTNTNTIIGILGLSWSYATRLCYDLVSGGYSDWYLPSKDELYKLYLNQVAIGGFTGGSVIYWSSSEQPPPQSSSAENLRFTDGASDYNSNNKSSTFSVRCARSF